MRVYDRGIRRRLAPMLGGDRIRIELAYSLLLTMPGTPVIIYGDEIGMGEDLQLKERWSVRTPMKWSDRPNGGFSKASADRLIEPVVHDGDYCYQKLNVVTAERDPRSLLHWVERAIRQRKLTPEFGSGTFRVIETDDPAVLAVRYDWDTGTIVAVHNLAAECRSVKLDLQTNADDAWIDVLSNRDYGSFDHRAGEIDGYGYRWLRHGGPRV
jgi:maltose alpha-D-glucosyltransferase/alpha-amylase